MIQTRYRTIVMDKELRLVVLGEIASMLMGLTLGGLGAYLAPEYIPTWVRWSVGLYLGFTIIAQIPLYYVHKGTRFSEERQ